MSTPPPAPARATFAGLDDNDALPPGTRFGELEIIRVVGVGGFGIVYLAQDHALEREVALKEYMPGTLAGRGNGKQVSVHSDAHAQTYALGLRSFVNEARLLARFNHPSLVKVYRFWEENGTAYMVMPFLQGRTLREVRKSMSQAPDQTWILSVINPMMDALEQLHREAVYHRDIAPDNVLLPPNELPVLLDFGAARRAISDRTQTFTAILKPSYAPIEQYAESTQMRQGPWTDIYALGAVIHYLLKGSPPPPATSRALQEDVSSLETENLHGTTPEFRAAVDWMLALRPGDRPQSIADLREVLQGRVPVPAHPTRAQAPAGQGGAAAPSYTTFAPTMKVGGLGVEPATQVVGRGGATAATSAATSAATAATGHAATAATGHAATSASFAETAIYKRPVGTDPDETLVIREALKGRGGQTGIHGAGSAASQSTVRTAAVIPPPARSSRTGLWLVIGACIVLLVGMGAWMMFFDKSTTRPVVEAPTPASSAAPVAVQTPPVTQTQAPVTTQPTTQATPQEAAPATAATTTPAAETPPATASVTPAASAATVAPAVVAPTTAAVTPPAATTTTAADKPVKAEAADATPRGNRLTPAEVRQAARDAREARQRAQQRSSPESTPPTAVYGDARTSPSTQARDDGNRRQTASRETTTAPVEQAPVRNAGPSSPREACGSRVFIALDICMEAQCKEARFATHPQCVRVREIEERRRRPDY